MTFLKSFCCHIEINASQLPLKVASGHRTFFLTLALHF